MVRGVTKVGARRSDLMRRWQAIPMAAAVALAVGVVLFGSGGATRVSASPQAGILTYSVSLDCDPGTAGVQSFCLLTTGTTSVDIDVVFTNGSGSALTLGSIGLDVLADQTIFAPNAGVNANKDGNPDFNESGWSAPTTCGLPAPVPDADLDPAVAQSTLVCYNGTSPSIANGGSLKLATVHYTSIDGVGAFSLANVAFGDQYLDEVMSCNPVIATEGACNGTSVQIGANTPTPTFTPTITLTPTETSTPTPVGTPATATSEAYRTVTPTGTPPTSTPSGSETAVATATDTAVVPPPVAPPPGTGDAGAGGVRPIRLPDTGGGERSTAWSAMSMIVLAALAAGTLAGGLYLGVAQAASARRKDGED
jgi:hypothetical protein